MNNGYFSEDLEAILESLESDESDEMDEWAEAKKKKKTNYKTKTASGATYTPKPSPNYVTEARLEAAMARVGAQIKTNSEAITAVNSRVNSLNGDVSRQTAAIKKEVEERKKDVNGLKSNVQMAALLPLLSKPSTRTISKNIDGLQANDRVLIDKGDSLTALLPILLLGGMGGTSSDGSSSGGGGMNDPSMMLVLALALSQGNK